MNKLYAGSIERAKNLYNDFDDILHDLSHSDRVAQNARQLGKELGYEDLDFLELCAYWHDAARTKRLEPHEEAGAKLAHDDLLAHGGGQDLADLAYEAIRFHKSTANPQTIEGKIIRDADKLDIYSLVRWQKCVDSGRFEDYIEELQRTIDALPRYPDVFTYDQTKKIYAERLPEFLKFCETHKER